MTDISSALSDPELGFLSFTVRRLTYRLSQGATSVAYTDHAAEGCIHPGTPEMVQLLPEEIWKLVRLRDWSAFGYCQGLAVLTDGEEPMTASGGNLIGSEVN